MYRSGTDCCACHCTRQIYRKQGLTQLENVSEQAAEQDGAGEAPPGANNLSKPISSEEAAAAAAAAAVRYKASTVPITDLPADLQRSPRDASSRGLPDAWYMLLKGDAEEGAIAELCDLITANNGTCGSHEVRDPCQSWAIPPLFENTTTFLHCP